MQADDHSNTLIAIEASEPAEASGSRRVCAVTALAGARRGTPPAASASLHHARWRPTDRGEFLINVAPLALRQSSRASERQSSSRIAPVQCNQSHSQRHKCTFSADEFHAIVHPALPKPARRKKKKTQRPAQCRAPGLVGVESQRDGANFERGNYTTFFVHVSTTKYPNVTKSPVITPKTRKVPKSLGCIPPQSSDEAAIAFISPSRGRVSG